MTIVTLSPEEFSTREISFSLPHLRQQLADGLRESREAGLDARVLLAGDDKPSDLCRGGMVVPQSPGQIITAVWPLADTPERERQLLEAYSAFAMGMSPPRTATLLSDLDVPCAPCGPFVPLTEVARYRGSGFSASCRPDHSDQFRFESHLIDDEAVLEILKSTEEGSPDMPEFLCSLDWRERLAEYQLACPQSPLAISSLRDQESLVGVAVWSGLSSELEGELYYLGIRPVARGNGWGKKLLQHVCSQARERGVNSMGLNVDLRNRAAIRLYQSAGFREVLRRRFWISRDGQTFSTGSTHDTRGAEVFCKSQIS